MRFPWNRAETELERELAHHLQELTAEYQRQGNSHEEAVRMAKREFGGSVQVKEQCRDEWRWAWISGLRQDIVFGVRLMRKTPVITLAVVLSLGIGIGANTAIFNLIDVAILRPLPVKDPGSLRLVEWTNQGFPAGVTNINGDFRRISSDKVQSSSVSANLYRHLARQQAGFQALIGIADPNSVAVIAEPSPAELVQLQYISSNFFQGLGVQPLIGRPFRVEEDRVGQEPVVIISNRFWVSRLGGGADALNRVIRINNVFAHVVGVAPPEFLGISASQWTDVYAPLAMRVAFEPNLSGPRGEDDRDWWVRQIGRLKPGVPEAIARAQVASLFRNMFTPEGTALEPNKIPELITVPGSHGVSPLKQKDASALWIVMLLGAVLLLIVCANVANLLLSRSVGRARESAVRLALGASSGRLFRQHLIESGQLAVLGGAVGLAFGYVLARSMYLLLQSGTDASNPFDIHLDLRVLGYTGAVSILTAFLFGLTPALRAAGAQLNGSLRAQARPPIRGRLRLHRLLVAFQIALCFTALVAAGLLGRSLDNLKSVDVGFDRENLAYATVNPWQSGYSAERVGPYIDRVREKLAGMPGIIGVSYLEVRLLSGNGNFSPVSVWGRQSPAVGRATTTGDGAHVNRVGDAALETLRIHLVTGRTLERSDIHPDAEAVVVDELFTRRFFPNQNPLGCRFGFFNSKNDRYKIVGVVRSSSYNSLREDPLPTVYAPFVPADLKGGSIHFAIRAEIDSGALTKEVRNAVASVDPAVPLTEFHTQNALIDRLLRAERLLAFLSRIFGVVALTLAAIGIGGLTAYSVSRRTNEIGVRMAVGASTGNVMRMVLRDSFGMVCTGIVIGLPCAYGIGKILNTMLFRLKPLDPATVCLTFLILFGVALVTALAPARRAARIDPLAALREE